MAKQEEVASAPVCGTTDSRNWDGKGNRQSQRVKDGGLRVILARLKNEATEFFRPAASS